jgi:hypothetical protein
VTDWIEREVEKALREWAGIPNPAPDEGEHITVSMVDPEPVVPEGVVIRYFDGSKVTVELVYGGIDPEDGLHCWMVTTTPRLGAIARVEVEMMPPLTKVQIGGRG